MFKVTRGGIRGLGIHHIAGGVRLRALRGSSRAMVGRARSRKAIFLWPEVALASEWCLLCKHHTLSPGLSAGR